VTAEAQVEETAEARQALFRQLNEQIRLLAVGFGLEAEFDLVCECGDGDCFERVTLSLEEFEEIRRHPNRFVVKVNHATMAERIVEQTSRFAAVERVEVAA
jgi:hypothetical protein